MKNIFIVVALIAGIHQAAAQGTRFFRISGPVATTITAFRPDGTIVWSNAEPGGTYAIQTARTLDSNWVDHIQISVTQPVNTNQLVSFNPPSGMRFIPAGSFTMGDTLDGETDAIPTNTVTVSAFYMEVNLVSSSRSTGARHIAAPIIGLFSRGEQAKQPSEGCFPSASVGHYFRGCLKSSCRCGHIAAGKPGLHPERHSNCL